MLKQTLRLIRNSCFLFLALGIIAAPVFAQNIPAPRRPASVTVRPYADSKPGLILLIDGKVAQVENIELIRDSHVLIWLRDLEKLGWGVIQPGEQGDVLFKCKSMTLTFPRDRATAKINSLTVHLPIDSCLRDGKLMVPLAFVADALGYHYSCSYIPVADICTVAPARTTNSMRGRVTFDDRPVAGITVRVVDGDFNTIKVEPVKTDSAGDFTFKDLPNGDFRAYIWTQDNPAYFIRTTDVIRMKGGADFDAGTIELGKIITPVKPSAGRAVKAQNGWIQLEWAKIENAVYKVRIKKKGSDQVVEKSEVNAPMASIPAAKLVPGQTYEVAITAANTSGENIGGTADSGNAVWTFIFER